jgi:hypothetical protein
MLFEGFQIEELSTPRGTVHALPRLYEDPLELWTPFAPRASGRQIDGATHFFVEDEPAEAADLAEFFA